MAVMGQSLIINKRRHPDGSFHAVIKVITSLLDKRPQLLIKRGAFYIKAVSVMNIVAIVTNNIRVQTVI